MNVKEKAINISVNVESSPLSSISSDERMDEFKLIENNNLNELYRLCCNNDIDLEIVDNYGNTLLLYACYLGRYNIVEILIEFGCNVDVINCYGQNALTLATYSGNLNIIKLLLKIRSYNDYLKSSFIPPLFIAYLKYHTHLIDYYKNLHHRNRNEAIDEIEKIQTIHGVKIQQLIDATAEDKQKTI